MGTDKQLERRFSPGGQVRVERREDGSTKIIGYGAVFYRADDPGTEYRLWAGAVERVARTAFDRAIADKDDVRGLFNHDPNQLLARTLSGTMRLSTDDKGLRYEVDVPDTPVAKVVVSAIERGDLTGSSFSFVAEQTTWIDDGDRDIRILDSVRLFDTGPVTFPAYQSTTAGVRMAVPEDIREEWLAWKAAMRAERIRKMAAAVIDTGRTP